MMRNLTQSTLQALIWPVLAGWLLAGCAVNEIPSNFQPSTFDPMGVVVLSVTRSGVTEFDLKLEMKPEQGGKTQVIMVSDVLKMDWKSPSGFKPAPSDSPAGKLVVFRIPPGKYRIFSWNGVSGLFGDDDSGYEVRSKPVSISFTAHQGKVTYVGNLHFAFPEKMNGYIYNGKYRFETRNSKSRDLAMLKQKVPGISQNDILQSPLKVEAIGKVHEFLIFNFYGKESSTP